MRINSGKSYQSRAWFLKKLGFKSYRDYLASPIWQRVREKVFRVKGRQCALCSREATQIHHNRYHEADLLGRKLKYIHPICGKCHEQIEFRSGEKATLAQAKQTFKKIRKAHVPELIERDQIQKLSILFMYHGESASIFSAWECDSSETKP